MPKWRPRVILWNCIKELLPPGSQQLPAKSEGFPTALGIDSVFWISARRAGITCAKKTYFFVTEQVLTWLQSPPSWQKTSPRGKRRKSNLVPHSWAESAQQWVPEMRPEQGGWGENRAGSKTKAAELPSWHQPAGSALSPNCIYNPRGQTHRWPAGKGVRHPPDYSDDVHQGTELSLVPPPPFWKGK